MSRPPKDCTPTYQDFDIDALLFGSKTCPCCGESKPRNAEAFARDNTERDGLTRECRRCRSARERGRSRRREVI